MLTDAYGKRTLDFVEDVQELKTYDDIARRTTEELDWFGLTRVTIWTLPGPGETVDSDVLLNNRPVDYIKHYVKKRYDLIDPVVVAMRTNVAPFTWDEVRARTSSKSGLRIMDEARDFEVTNGMIVPISSEGKTVIFSPCGREPILTPRARTAVEMIGIYSQQALKRAQAKDRRTPQLPPLSPREREVLSWVATGKSDDEIASILNIQATTVLTHVENAKRKMNATRRTFAVIQALRSGNLDL